MKNVKKLKLFSYFSMIIIWEHFFILILWIAFRPAVIPLSVCDFSVSSVFPKCVFSNREEKYVSLYRHHLSFHKIRCLQESCGRGVLPSADRYRLISFAVVFSKISFCNFCSWFLRSELLICI